METLKPKCTYSVSPNLKDTSKKIDLDTRKGVAYETVINIKDMYDVCVKNGESLVIVLSNLCTFGNPEAKAIANEIVKEVAVKKGV